MTGGRSIGTSLIITGHFDRQVFNLPVFNKCDQLKNGNYRLTATLIYTYILYILFLVLLGPTNVSLSKALTNQLTALHK
ncbi:hypothetical protein KUCAC02_005624 [Chaenocephalus aceratus]|uniref:Uncharacterized protein n=1 Tax=Chaenocephalus aceratus TaxID=36190 RepID=A0ACB9WPZ2_CHAAC|nr:hypothetical protein KUCAC02_005624 [Chaenocephalus aceratus]